MTEQSLKDRTINGVGWITIGSVFGYSILFLVGLILARLLSPDEYGLIGIVTFFVTTFDAFAESGFSSALIRKMNADERDYNTAFFLMLFSP